MSDTKLDWINVATMATGLDLKVAAHVLDGARPGPTVALTAGIHGDELLPVEIVRRVLDRIATDRLAGRIVAIPVANPLAFETFTRHTPTDQHNLNRMFPGDSDTWLTELLAKALVDYLVPHVDALIDLHSGGAVPTVDYVYVLNDVALSRSFLFPTLYQGSSYPGSLGTYFIQQTEKPVVVAEIGGGNQRDDSYLERGVAGVENALRQLGVLDGDPTPAPAQRLLTKMQIRRPRHGGILHPQVTVDQLGTLVERGTVLGRTRNPQTFEIVEEFTAPFDRTHLVLARCVISKVHPGDYAYMLGDEGSAEELDAQ